MSALLHVDSSINGDASHSRKVTAAFAEHWRAAHPGGRYVYRDVAAHPIPHLDRDTYRAINTPEAEITAAQAASSALSREIIDEVVAADTILLGVPMYNFTVSSHLKAWLDRIAIARFRADANGHSELSGTRIVVATSRGGAYGPGTPREPYDHQEPYLRHLFEYLGAGDDMTFLHTEMTLSLVVPALADFQHIFETSSAQAHAHARELASA